jgi:hypothetical protein
MAEKAAMTKSYLRREGTDVDRRNDGDYSDAYTRPIIPRSLSLIVLNTIGASPLKHCGSTSLQYIAHCGESL